MKVLVTGSEGFIGRNLIKRLKEMKHDVVTFDTKMNDLNDFFVDVDIHSIDHIFHLGAISSTLETDVHKLYQYNVEYSIDLFNTAIYHKIPVTYTSSASVYGNTMKDGQYIYNPLNYYATTKMIVEMWLRENKDRFQKLYVPRLFNVYGEDENKPAGATSPVSKFMHQAKTDGVIRVFKGSENMIRDFICVEDVVRVLTQDMPPYGRWRGEEFFDLGTTIPISFLEVAQLVSEKYDVGIKFIDMPDYMKPSYQYYTKARQGETYTKTVESWLENHS
jgi:ADP-L-glycero-D-manno-heptose 6-epimerase